MTQLQDAPASQTASPEWSTEDVGNIIALEHVNTCCDDQTLTTAFYIMGMGFTRDPYINVGLNNFWVNIGDEQIHIPTRPSQVLPGHVGVVVPNLNALASRLESVKELLAGTKFSYEVKSDHVVAVSPWGNVFHAYEPDPRFGGMRIGIPYVEVRTRRGVAAGIARFYQQIMKAPAEVVQDADGASTHVRIGTYQTLIFRESDAEVPPYDKHHIAVYTADFTGPYNWLLERKLVTEEARRHQFRFQDIVDPETGELLHTLEHEVRGLFHLMYKRPMANRNADQNMGAYARGGDILTPF
jgi:hypothetical protein